MKINTAVYRWSLILLFLFACLSALLFVDLKIRALGFHQRDYPFYLQFAAKLFDPQLTNRFSLNPDGFNFLGNVGTEGADSFHQSIHLEPVRYLYALAYALTGQPLGVFALVALLYFLPVVYLAFAAPRSSRLDTGFLLLFVLLYVLHPLSLAAVADDLRPRTLMIPALVLAFLSVHWQRRWVEKLAFFALLLLTREEAVILAAGLIAYDFFRTRALGLKNGTPLLFAGVWLVWIGVQSLYFRWAGYAISQDLTPFQVLQNLLGSWLWIAVAAAAAVISGFACRARARRWLSFPHVPAIGVYLTLVLLPLLVQLVREEAHWFRDAPFLPALSLLLKDLFFLPKNAIFFAASLLLLLQIWDLLRAGGLRRWILAAMSVFLAVSALIGGLAAWQNAGTYRAAIPATAVLADLRAVTIPQSTVLLTDYTANQAFYDYENLLVYERLPAYLLPGEARFYPASQPLLLDLIRDRVEWVAVGAQSKQAVLRLCEEAQIQVQVVAENDQFSVMRLR